MTLFFASEGIPSRVFFLAHSGMSFDLLGQWPERPKWTSECREAHRNQAPNVMSLHHAAPKVDVSMWRRLRLAQVACSVLEAKLRQLL